MSGQGADGCRAGADACRAGGLTRVGQRLTDVGQGADGCRAGGLTDVEQGADAYRAGVCRMSDRGSDTPGRVWSMWAVPDRCWRFLTDNRQARRAPLSAQRSASLLPLPDGVSVLPSARRASVCCPLPDERQRAALCPTIVSLLPLA